MTRPLANITREVLEPVWMRHDIPTEVIAARLGVTRQGLSYKAKSLGLPSRTGNQDSNKRCCDGLFRRMYEAGVRLRDIAAHCGYSSVQNVTQRRRMMGLAPRTQHGEPGTISMAEFMEMELARCMARDAAAIRERKGRRWHGK